MIGHGYREKGHRPVPCLLVKVAGAGEIKLLAGVGVLDIHRFTTNRSPGRDHVLVGFAIGTVEGYRVEFDFLITGATLVYTERLGNDDLEFQALVVSMGIQRTTIGVGDFHGLEQDHFQQAAVIVLRRQRHADVCQLF